MVGGKASHSACLGTSGSTRYSSTFLRTILLGILSAFHSLEQLASCCALRPESLGEVAGESGHVMAAMSGLVYPVSSEHLFSWTIIKLVNISVGESSL